MGNDSARAIDSRKETKKPRFITGLPQVGFDILSPGLDAFLD
jgi:hypothetical protein